MHWQNACILHVCNISVVAKMRAKRNQNEPYIAVNLTSGDLTLSGKLP